MNLHLNIRPPAVAGSFYPGNIKQLDSSVQTYLDDVKITAIQTKPRALIVPHAGYIYSGPIAASAYAQLIPFAGQITTVVLLGPSHRIPLLGIASSSADYFQTPLGEIPLDRKIIDKLEQLPFVQSYDDAHRQEHSLEVQLPFLQKILPEFTLVPLVIGQTDDQQVSELIETLWQEQDTLFLISSDLSHYLDYHQAQLSDQAASEAIAELIPQNIHYEQACGRSGIAGMLLSAKKHHLNVQMLDLRNSGDTAGTKDRVVGYGSWVFY
ncbi:MAG: AmmeMemoRadiSam system protein B [Gammaproteobacteria bacterium]|nr:AmmeMemoRadiSam system protein B [Gammaproteobacteria bacterium]